MKRIFPLMVGIAVGCTNGDATNRTQQVVVDSPRVVIDSVFPVEEEIRRFKASRNGVSAAGLQGGATSRDQLIEWFITALEQRDTARLRAIVLDAGEFIDLYYPASQYSRPPYKQSPELRWFLMQESSSKGLTRLLQRYGGSAHGYRSYQCAPQPLVEGAHKLWDRCVVIWRAHPAPVRLFSTIIERDGSFKIMSYANDL